jgi:hypothetical protein
MIYFITVIDGIICIHKIANIVLHRMFEQLVLNIF